MPWLGGWPQFLWRASPKSLSASGTPPAALPCSSKPSTSAASSSSSPPPTAPPARSSPSSTGTTRPPQRRRARTRFPGRSAPWPCRGPGRSAPPRGPAATRVTGGATPPQGRGTIANSAGRAGRPAHRRPRAPGGAGAWTRPRSWGRSRSPSSSCAAGVATTSAAGVPGAPTGASGAGCRRRVTGPCSRPSWRRSGPCRGWGRWGPSGTWRRPWRGWRGPRRWRRGAARYEGRPL
mmetsp:Transcript_32829/g.85224  ORF Transcript_32829/g.85224 Transcript_32829/m.85224 type:complete len:235 (+) Transcript_32829:906-1610(+)